MTFVKCLRVVLSLVVLATATARVDAASPPATLPAARILDLSVKQDAQGLWWLDMNYELAYTATPVYIDLKVDLLPRPAEGIAARSGANLNQVLPGRHHVHIVIAHPGTEAITSFVVVSLVSRDTVMDSRNLQQPIKWGSSLTYSALHAQAREALEEQLSSAVAMIDQGGEVELKNARSALQTLLIDNPRLDAAYIELARVAMKLNWSDEGLQQAEQFLQTAQSIAPDNPNTEILMGYVYTHQKRFGEAEAMFRMAESRKTPNLWLWFNWGELLTAQGKLDQAIAKYRQAISAPASSESHDKARLASYTNLLNLFRDRGDLDGMEFVHQRRLAEYGPNVCYGRAYAMFLLQQRGKPDEAIVEARKNGNITCPLTADQDLMGLAFYMKWSRTEGEARTAALGLARSFMPTSAHALHLLAQSEYSVAALHQLIKEGTKIDMRDADGQSALALSLTAGDYDTARRLVDSGANVNQTVGMENLPLGLVPVMLEDAKGVRALRKLGVNYKSLRFQGTPAIEIARSVGGPDLVQAMTGEPSAL